MKNEETQSVHLTVQSVRRVDSSKIFATASVELVIAGVSLLVHGVQAVRDAGGTRIVLPKIRTADGRWTPAIELPEEVKEPMGDAVLEALISEGLAKPRFKIGEG